MKTLTCLLALAFTLPISAQMPQPTAEHRKLGTQVGSWEAIMKYTGADGSPTRSAGISVRKKPLGGFWLLDNFQANLMGQKFLGHGTTGYDPSKKKYVGTWIDSMTPTLMVLEGNFDKTGKVLTMTGIAPGMDGKLGKHRLVTTFKDANKHVFEMYALLWCPGHVGTW
jgi:hypothetical protein